MIRAYSIAYDGKTDERILATQNGKLFLQKNTIKKINKRTALAWLLHNNYLHVFSLVQEGEIFGIIKDWNKMSNCSVPSFDVS